MTFVPLSPKRTNDQNRCNLTQDFLLGSLLIIKDHKMRSEKIPKQQHYRL